MLLEGQNRGRGDEASEWANGGGWGHAEGEGPGAERHEAEDPGAWYILSMIQPRYVLVRAQCVLAARTGVQREEKRW